MPRSLFRLLPLGRSACGDAISLARIGANERGELAKGIVASRANAGDVKKLVKQLKLKARREVIEHRRVDRPWGHYKMIDAGARYQVKRIVVNPGATLSL